MGSRQKTELRQWNKILKKNKTKKLQQTHLAGRNKPKKKNLPNTIERWAGAAAIGRGFEQERQRLGAALSRGGAIGRHEVVRWAWACL